MPTSRRSWDSFEVMRQAAQAGNPQAQCYLGVCYQTGQGVELDYPEAVKWFRRAAEQNDPVAQCYLGVCYLHGAGVPQEYGEAAKWLREAGEQGDPAAQFNLGVLYETGQGVPAKLRRSRQMVPGVRPARLSGRPIQSRRVL